jgi:hypothetical protein
VARTSEEERRDCCVEGPLITEITTKASEEKAKLSPQQAVEACRVVRS